MDKDWLEFILTGLKKDIADAKKELKEELSTVKSQVNTLLEFKWKIYGMALASGIIGAGIGKVLLKFIGV